MAVLDPLQVVIENYPEGQVEEMDVVNNPEDPSAGTRKVPFSRVLYIEQDDFREDPPKKFFRLAPGREVRLRNAYLITCSEVVKDDPGEIVELRCTYDPATRGGDAPDGRKVKATLHWVSARMPSTARCGCTIGCSPSRTRQTAEGKDWRTFLNPNSLEVSRRQARAVARIARPPGSRFQFERIGYFAVDPDTTAGVPCSTAR